MDEELILAIDQGTTSSRALLVDRSGHVQAAGSAALSIRSPRAGWVEQDPNEIWESVVDAISSALAGCPDARIGGVAVSNQRETVVAWAGQGDGPVGPAISWQDQRGDPLCRELATDENRAIVRRASGLELSSMFSASKMARFMERYDFTHGLRIGTVDAWLLDRLTGGATYATEVGNASRTLLLDIERRTWSAEVARLFGIDPTHLPGVRPSNGPWGVTRGVTGVPDGTPILAVLGDSHAALYGHWALSPDFREVGKATYGTGSSVMIPTRTPSTRVPGVSTTLAWQVEEPMWAVEGNILYSGAGIDWLAGVLGCAPGRAFTELASQADDSHGTIFVPALNGLGAPWWTASAAGTLTGLTSATSRAEIARAGIDAVAHQVCDVVDAMDPDRRQTALHAGGGATRSPLLMQVQADLLGRTLLVSHNPDISALGAAALAFQTAGIKFAPAADLAPTEVQPSPSFSNEDRVAARTAWRGALTRAGVALPLSPTHSSTTTPKEIFAHD